MKKNAFWRVDRMERGDSAPFDDIFQGKPHINRKMTIWEGGELLNSARIDWLVHNDNINNILGISLPLTVSSLLFI